MPASVLLSVRWLWPQVRRLGPPGLVLAAGELGQQRPCGGDPWRAWQGQADRHQAGEEAAVAGRAAAAAGPVAPPVGQGAAVPTARLEEAGHHALDIEKAAAAAGQVAAGAAGQTVVPADWQPAAAACAGVGLA